MEPINSLCSPSTKIVEPPKYYKPLVHNNKRRAHFKDYSRPGTYMLTMVTNMRQPLFGTLACDPQPHILLTPFGEAIRHREIHMIHANYPNVFVWKTCIMPDHLHLIVNIKTPMPDGKHLGDVIAGFKLGCNRAYWQMTNSNGIGIFEEGYNDRILRNGEMLKCWKRYLDDNPLRLAIKRSVPELFTTIRNLEVCGRKCELFGNRFLLNIPDKMAVVVHRTDSQEVFEKKKSEWLKCGARGGVLVGAAVSSREKEVINLARNRGYCVIRLTNNGFDNFYKPSGQAFYECSEGRLLELSPWPYTYQNRLITRLECLALNRLACEITGECLC